MYHPMQKKCRLVHSPAFHTRIYTWPKHSSAGCSSCESLAIKHHLCNRNWINGGYQVNQSCLLNIPGIAYRVRSWSIYKNLLCMYICEPIAGHQSFIQFLNLLACFQLYKVKWSSLDTRLNCLKAGQTVGNLLNHIKTASTTMKTVAACQTDNLSPEWHESWQNNLQKHTSIVNKDKKSKVNHMSKNLTNTSIDEILKAICASICWVLLARLTSKANTNKKN